MRKFIFTEPFTYIPDEDRRISISYKAKVYTNVRKAAAEKAIAAGCGHWAGNKPKSNDESEDANDGVGKGEDADGEMEVADSEITKERQKTT